MKLGSLELFTNSGRLPFSFSSRSCRHPLWCFLHWPGILHIYDIMSCALPVSFHHQLTYLMHLAQANSELQLTRCSFKWIVQKSDTIGEYSSYSTSRHCWWLGGLSIPDHLRWRGHMCIISSLFSPPTSCPSSLCTIAPIWLSIQLANNGRA